MTPSAPPTAMLSVQHRARLRDLADVIVPGFQQMPSASAVGLAGDPVDRVLRMRPDLKIALERLLDTLAGTEPAETMRSIAAQDPAALEVLMQVVVGAYCMEPRVRDALGYSGQQALTLDRGGFGGEDLLLAMMDSPPRYRTCDGSG